MAATTLRQPWLSSENKPLLWALLISVVVHALAFWLLFVVAVASILFSSAKREAIAEMLRTQEARARTQPDQEPQLTFVQVDPSQATPDAPKNAKYYSSQNSRAANPDPQADTQTPKIDGTQTHVPKTETTPRNTQFPLQPSQPSQPKNAASPDKKEESKPEQRPKPGDLAMVRPEDKPAKDPSDNPQVGHERPRTLAEAHMLAGDKMKQEGGVKRGRVNSSFDAIGSPFGEYDERVIAAIQQHWYDLLDSQNFSQDHGGRVVVQFHINRDGSITDMHVMQTDVGPVLTQLCVAAISEPSPYESWPQAMYRRIKTESGKDYREVQFTFFYEW